MSKLIDRHQLNTLIQSNANLVLLEALPEKYFQDWHLPGAKHMPHDQTRALAPRLLPEKQVPVVVYCASATCQNSHMAARALEQLGYADVAVYAGGKQDWSDAGLPIERPDRVMA